MGICEVIKNQKFFEELAMRKENFPSAMLFLCDDELTSNTTLILTALMLEFPAFQLFDENSAEFRRFASGVDVDVKVFPLAEKLLVSDSEAIVDEAYIKPINFERKIFIIKNIDNSTEEAQNKLLKIIEEPPQNVVFLISAKSEERVLATIRSRCQKTKILPLKKEEIEKFCSNKLAVALGGGYIGKTQDLERRENLPALVNFAISLFTEMKSSKDVIRFSRKFTSFGDDIDLVLEVMLLCIEDILKTKCECENLCSLSSPELDDVEPEFSVEALCEISPLISKFREKIEFNGNVQVGVDNLLLKMLEVKFLCK